jgi:chemotaxis protein MotB
MKWIRTSLMGVMLLGVLCSAGCFVSQDDFDEVVAHNSRLSRDNAELNSQVASLEAENEALREQAAMGTEGQQLALLQEEHDILQDDYYQLLDAYRAAVANQGGMDPLPEAVNLELEALASQYPNMIEFLPNYGMIKFKADLTFARGSDELGPEASAALAEFASILGGTDMSGFNIYIAGHTDDMRIANPQTLLRHPTNWYLSVHRAVVVQEALENAGIAPDRLAVLGFGEYRPAEPNAASGQGNPANRRVELWIASPDLFSAN